MNEKRRTKNEEARTAPLVHESGGVPEYNLTDRTFAFGCNVARLCDRLDARRPVVRRLSFKLLNSGTSVGANIEEGRAGQTKPGFIAKNFISLKEARETRFWLRVIGEVDAPMAAEIQPLLKETNELIAILTSTLKNARSSPERG